VDKKIKRHLPAQMAAEAMQAKSFVWENGDEKTVEVAVKGPWVRTRESSLVTREMCQETKREQKVSF